MKPEPKGADPLVAVFVFGCLITFWIWAARAPAASHGAEGVGSRQEVTETDADIVAIVGELKGQSLISYRISYQPKTPYGSALKEYWVGNSMAAAKYQHALNGLMNPTTMLSGETLGTKNGINNALREEPIIAEASQALSASLLTNFQSLKGVYFARFVNAPGTRSSELEHSIADWDTGEKLSIKSYATTRVFFESLKSFVDLAGKSRIRWNSNNKEINYPSPVIKSNLERAYAHVSRASQEMGMAHKASDEWWDRSKHPN